MADRLHQELLAVSGLEQVSALQLHELPWKTREQIFVALFQEHASSVSVAEALRVVSRDRRLERKTERAEDAERDVVRKNEERFRSECMRIAATELSRLGAPTMITWQKLVYDKDCCSQAFRILLTKIKSSKRSNNSSSSGGQSMRRSIALAKRFTAAAPEAEDTDGGNNDDLDPSSDAGSVASFDRAEASLDSRETLLPRIPGPKSMIKPRSVPMRPPVSKPSASSGGWNSDTNVASDAATERVEDERFEDQNGFGTAEISIQRTSGKPILSAATSAFASKLKKSQLHSLQQETAALADENAALRSEVTHLEELVVKLQNENNQRAASGETPEAVNHARMKLLQAQNMQLQRQIALLQDAVQEREIAESMLHTALSHWREVIEAGRQEAKAAGAEENSKTKDGKPVQWMMAVPSQLLEELTRVESQVAHMKKTMSIACEAKLRVGGTAADFLKHSSSGSVNFSDLYVPGVAHLRVERVKKLETALVQAVRALEATHQQITDSVVPRMQDDTGRTSRDKISAREINELLLAVRAVTLEVVAFGIVVPSVRSQPQPGSSSTANVESLVTVADVLRAYAAASAAASGVTAKDKDKQLKTMLKQLQASESAMERQCSQLKKETSFWKNAWAMQEQLLHTLTQRVRNVGDKKMQWAESYLIHPLRELQEVWVSFQKAQKTQQDQRIHKNAYLPLLIDTLQRHEPVVCLDAIDQWQQYAARYNQEIAELFADYDANCQLLGSYIHGATSTAVQSR